VNDQALSKLDEEKGDHRIGEKGTSFLENREESRAKPSRASKWDPVACRNPLILCCVVVCSLEMETLWISMIIASAEYKVSLRNIKC